MTRSNAVTIIPAHYWPALPITRQLGLATLTIVFCSSLLFLIKSNAMNPNSERNTELDMEENSAYRGEDSTESTVVRDEDRQIFTTNKDQPEEAGSDVVLVYTEQSPSSKSSHLRWGPKEWFNWWRVEQEPRIAELKNDLKICKADLKEEEKMHTSTRKALTREKNNLLRELTDVNRDKAELSNQIFSLKQRSKEDKDRWEHEVSFLDQQLKQITREKKALADELGDERSFTKQLQAEKKANQAIVAKAQTAAVNALSQSVSSELPDDVIQSRFSEILEEAQDWARENSNPTLQQESLSEARSSLQNFLLEKHLLSSNTEMKRHEQFDISVDSAADTLLETVISHELCLTFLQNPYFLSSWLVSETEAEPVVEAPVVLKGLEEHMMTDHYDEALAWRAKTLQLTSGKDEQSISARKKSYQAFTFSFLRRWNILIRGDIAQAELQEERNILLSLVTKFGDLALELWGLEREIKLEGLEYFASKPFQVRSTEMVAAKITRLQEGSTRLDGCKIPLVIQPMIASYVRIKGQNAQRRIIWSKGVVWISNRKEVTVQAQSDVPAPSDKMDVTDASSVMDEL